MCSKPPDVIPEKPPQVELSKLGSKDNKAGERLKYLYSEEYLNRPMDNRVFRKVRFRFDYICVQSLYCPSNQFEFPTKKELEEWGVLRPQKRNQMEEESPPTSSPSPIKKKKRKKSEEDEDFTPDLADEDSSDADQNDNMENHDLNELLGKDRRVNIEFNDSNMGFLLQPVAGRFKAMVAQVTRELMESEKLYPGMRVCSIDNNPIAPSSTFAEIQATIQNLRFPALIEFVDVYRNRCKICLRGFVEYDQLILHMLQHTRQQEQTLQVDQMKQREQWLMNLQLRHPIMYQQYVVQHQIGRLHAHIESLQLDPTMNTQLQQALALMDNLKNHLIVLSHQQRAGRIQNQQSLSARSDMNAFSPQGINGTPSCKDTMGVADTGPLETQLTNSQGTAAVQSSQHQLQHLVEPQKETGTPEQTLENVSNPHPNAEQGQQASNIQIALGQLATLKQIYTRSPQTAVAQLAGLLQMAEKNEVAVGQLINLQRAAKTDVEFSSLFSQLQATAYSVLQQHVARQKVQKETLSHKQNPAQDGALAEKAQVSGIKIKGEDSS